MESVGRLAGGVAHDFNNMLAVILMHTEMALMTLDPSNPIHADLEEIQKAGKRSADLTTQLLAFARKQVTAPKVLDLNETVEGMLKMLRRLIGEDIDLSWNPNSDIGKVTMDPSQLDQILTNLCVNAVTQYLTWARLPSRQTTAHSTKNTAPSTPASPPASM